MNPTDSGRMAKIRVLIVDDKQQVRRDLKTALELAEGLEVIGEAAGGLEAVWQAEKLNPDVVLMDLKMRDMDGFEATRHIKSRHLARGVVALTIYNTNSVRERAAKAGADVFIEKGTNIPNLIEAIRKAASSGVADKLN